MFFSSQSEGWDFNVFTDLESPTEFHFSRCSIWASALINLACFFFLMSSCSSLSTWGDGNFCTISGSEFVWQGLKGIFEQIQYLNDIWQGTHLYLSCSSWFPLYACYHIRKKQNGKLQESELISLQEETMHCNQHIPCHWLLIKTHVVCNGFSMH